MRTTKIRHARTNRKQHGVFIFGNESRGHRLSRNQVHQFWSQCPDSTVSTSCPTDGLQARLGVTERQPLHKCVKSSLCKLKTLRQLNSHANQIIELYYIKSSREISSYCCACASHYSSSGSKSMTCVSLWSLSSVSSSSSPLSSSGPGARVQLTLLLPFY